MPKPKLPPQGGEKWLCLGMFLMLMFSVVMVSTIRPDKQTVRQAAARFCNNSKNLYKILPYIYYNLYLPCTTFVYSLVPFAFAASMVCCHPNPDHDQLCACVQVVVAIYCIVIIYIPSMNELDSNILHESKR